MSTSRGNHQRSRPQKHQNKSAFKNDLHDTSKRTKQINSLVVSGVCKRCKDVIEWKIKYKKYKALSAPSKCVACGEKNVRHAYHVLCSNCAKEKNVCAKCNKPVEDEIIPEIEKGQNADLKSILNSLPERKRRTVLRFIQKQSDDTVNNEILEEILSKIGEVNLLDNNDDLSFSESEEE